MSPPSYGYWLMREATLSFSLSEDFAKDFMHWRTSRPHDYTLSPLNAEGDDNAAFKEGLADGEPARNVCLGGQDYLHDHLGAGFHLLVFPAAAQLSQDERALLALTEVNGAPVETMLIGAEDKAAKVCLPDPGGRIAQKYGVDAGGVYLLRPDLHICGRWKSASREKIVAAIQHALCGEETSSC
jgi:3-(3-hydroxy-phenyl)propionate hydroxylase